VDWWQGVTLLMHEQTRVRVRDLAKLLARRSHKIVCVDFEDQFGRRRRGPVIGDASLAVQPIMIQAGGDCARGGPTGWAWLLG
jgi:hypothetical protein